MSTIVRRPPVRWAGCKQRVLPALTQYVPTDASRLVEPFCGSAALFFSRHFASAWLSDINPDLIGAFRYLRDEPDELHAVLSQLATDRDTYYDLRAALPFLDAGIERAAVFLHLNRLCFNGLYRTNRRGEFNVPYGGDSCAQLAHREQFRLWSRKLQLARLDCLDYQSVLSEVDDRDFVYLDPPYTTRSARVFDEYHSQGFRFEDLSALRQILDTLTSRSVRFTLSFSDSPEGHMLARGFDSHPVTVRRSIAGFVESRILARELVIRNWRAS